MLMLQSMIGLSRISLVQVGPIKNPLAHGISRGIIDSQDKIWVYNWDGNDDRIGIDYEIGELIHVALVHDDGTLYAYKNGVLVD